MKRRSKAGGEPIKGRASKGAKAKAPRCAQNCVLVRPYRRCRGRSAHPRTERSVGATERRPRRCFEVISGSPGDLQPVFAAMLENAVRICDAKFGNIYRWDGEALHLVAAHNTPPAFVEARRSRRFLVPVRNQSSVAWSRPKPSFTSRIFRQNRPTLKTAFHRLLQP